MTPASAAVPAATVPAATTVPACGSAYVPGANYECQAVPQSNFCKQEKMHPGGMYSGSAWTNPDPCDPSTFTGAMIPASAAVPAPTVPVAPAAAPASGCFPTYAAGTAYAGGALVVATND